MTSSLKLLQNNINIKSPLHLHINDIIVLCVRFKLYHFKRMLFNLIKIKWKCPVSKISCIH